MKISKMVQELMELRRQHGDLDVLFQEHDFSGPFMVGSVRLSKVEEDEDGPACNLPDGAKFVELLWY